jgi:hypothetical protein
MRDSSPVTLLLFPSGKETRKFRRAMVDKCSPLSKSTFRCRLLATQYFPLYFLFGSWNASYFVEITLI